MHEDVVQGFILDDSDETFVGREEAAEIATKCGQANKATLSMLYSEDLWQSMKCTFPVPQTLMRIHAQIDTQLETQFFRSQLESQFGTQIWAQLRTQLRTQLKTCGNLNHLGK